MNPELERIEAKYVEKHAHCPIGQKCDCSYNALQEAYELGRKEEKEETKKKVLDWFCNLKFKAKD